MNNDGLKSGLVFFATIFGLIVVLIDDRIETTVKIIAIAIAVLILVVFEWRHYRKYGEGNLERSWLVGVLSKVKSIFKQQPLSLLIFPVLVVSLLVLAFFRFSVSVDQNFVSGEEYVNFTKLSHSQICPVDHSIPENKPIVDVTAQCALAYADYRSNWCCKFELPGKQDVDANPVVSDIENCTPGAEFVFDKPGKDEPVLSIRQGNSIKSVRTDVKDKCTSFRLKRSCNLLCAFSD